MLPRYQIIKIICINQFDIKFYMTLSETFVDKEVKVRSYVKYNKQISTTKYYMLRNLLEFVLMKAKFF